MAGRLARPEPRHDDEQQHDPDEIPADEQPGSAGDRAQHWTFAAGCLLGLIAGGTIFWWMLTHNGTEIVPAKSFAGSFFDIQGRAILDRRLDVPADSLGIEGFVVDGRTYAYFGPVPAIIRLPVLAVTNQLDGRMSVISIAVGWTVGAIFTSLLLWRTRRFVRGDLPFTNTELAATALALAAYGGGSSLVILAARPIVYQEADVWGSALTLASLWAVLGVLERLTYPRVILGTVFASLAFLTRATLGLVATVTLAAITVAVAGEWIARRRHPGHDAQRIFGRTHIGWAMLGALALGTIVPVAAYASVNVAKFDTPFRLPMETQVMSGLDPARKEMLRANGNSFFRPQFVATTALTYLRPDGLRLSSDFPFIFLPEQPQAPVGDYVFDRIDPTPGLFPTMPFWAGLTAWGLICAFRPNPRCRPAVKRLRTPLIGAATGSLGVLTIAFIAPRYLGDFLPFLVLAGAVGLYDVIDRTDGTRRLVRGGLLAVLASATAVSMVVNVAIGYTIRSVEGSPAELASYLGARLSVGAYVGGKLSARVERGDRVSRRGGYDRLFIRGNCDGLYWSGGGEPAALAITNWQPIERGPAAGQQHVAIEFGTPPAGSPARQPILGIDDKLAPTTLYVERLPDGKARFGAMVGDREAGPPGAPLILDPARTYDAVIVADEQTAELSLTLDGERVFDTTSVATGAERLGGPATLDAGLSPTPPPAAPSPSTAPQHPPGDAGTSAEPTTTTTTTAARSRSSPTTATTPNPSPPLAASGPALAPRFTGTITARSNDLPLCRALLDELEGRG